MKKVFALVLAAGLLAFGFSAQAADKVTADVKVEKVAPKKPAEAAKPGVKVEHKAASAVEAKPAKPAKK